MFLPFTLKVQASSSHWMRKGGMWSTPGLIITEFLKTSFKEKFLKVARGNTIYGDREEDGRVGKGRIYLLPGPH